MVFAVDYDRIRNYSRRLLTLKLLYAFIDPGLSLFLRVVSHFYLQLI